VVKANASREAHGQRGAASTKDAPAGDVPLRDPVLAAFWAWLIPGAGHWYQGRRSKAVLFFVCIMGTFVYGLYLGGGRVVYASWRPDDHRLPYLCQIGVGVAAMPALVQAYRARSGQHFLQDSRFMVPPDLKKREVSGANELDDLQKRLGRYFELGTVYTMIAGLLNVLVIYDAWGGPAEPPLPAKKDDEDEDRPPDADRGG
jgi:Family of unknown function (DUF6677)